MILFYISGHGFGHAARESAVIKALKHIDPDIEIAVKSSAALWFLQESLPPEVKISYTKIDVGVVQHDSLKSEIEKTFIQYQKLIEKKCEIISEEKEWCIRNNVEIIVSDVPPFAFDIAHQIGIPSVFIGNFSWDWIYEEYLDSFPRYKHIVEHIRHSEAKCSLCLYTPFSAGLSAFPVQKQIGLICRKSNLSKSSARDRAGFPPNQRIILFSFGGFGLDEAAEITPILPDDVIVVCTQPDIRKNGWVNITREEMRSKGLSYEDIVRACDVVVTKPGYGIVSECIANCTPMLYVDRALFREYPVIETEMSKYLPCVKAPMSEFLGGKWWEYLQSLWKNDFRLQNIDTNGNIQAAEEILKLIK